MSTSVLSHRNDAERKMRDTRSRFDSELFEDETLASGKVRTGVRFQFLFEGFIRRTEIVNVTNQLAVMTTTGITLVHGLEAIIEQEQNKALADMLQNIKSSIQAGDDFSKAIARYPRHFDNTYTSMVEASEQTGRLAETLNQIAAYMEKKIAYASKIKSAMAYPAVILALTIGVTLYLLTNIMPKFQPLFDREGATLPLMTQVLINASKLLLDYLWYWMAGAVLSIGGFFYWKASRHGQNCWDWLLIKAPIMGPLFRKLIISRSILTLGVMLDCGVSVLEAIRLTSKVAGNVHYRRVWEKVIERVSSGDRIVTALRGEKLFPATLIQMINAGEESGKLDEVLAKVSAFYEREVDTQIKTMSTIVEPLLIVIMGSVVGAIAMAIMLPIFSLSQQI